MDHFHSTAFDLLLESVRAATAAGLFIYVLIAGRRSGQHTYTGWNLVVGGFGLLLFASVLDVTDNFSSLNHFIVIGYTPEQAFLKNFVGYLGGFMLLLVGFLRWLPLVAEGARSREHQLLEEFQQRYRDLVELSPDAIILHRKGKIIYANAAAAEMVGAPQPDALIGKAVMGFVHPDYQKQTQERLEALAADGISDLPLVNIKVLTTAGEVRDVEAASGLTNFKGEKVFQSVLRDISSRVRAEEALKESESELRSIFDSMAEFYYRADKEGRIIRASGAAFEVTGLNHEDIIGVNLTNHYVDPDGRAKFLQAMEDAHGVLRNYEAQITRHDGERIWVSTNAHYTRDKDGNITGVEGTTRNITETVQARDVLQHMAMHDVLTGLGNRRSFEARLKESLPRARRAENGGAILYFDLDGFKGVNDTHGHDVGDSVLRLVGKRLKALARETDYVARIGGDEFCLIIEGASDLTAIERVAEKLIATVMEPYPVNDLSLNLGVSVGIMPFDGSESDADVHALITQADRAMYQAKQSGGNAYRFAPKATASQAVS